MNPDKISKLIRTREEVSNIYNKLHRMNFRYPYSFEISNNKQLLYFLGVHHTSDYKDPQIARILKQWQSFLKIVNRDNAIVLIEGSLRPIEENVRKAITNHSEAGLMTFLANKERIEVISPEPDSKKEIEAIANKFGKEKTIYYYFARTVYQWQKHARKTTNFEPYITIYLSGYKKLLKWDSFDFNLENMIKLHDKFHNHKFNLADEKCFYKDSSPENDVSNMSAAIRDTYMISEIIKLWSKGSNVFIVYGSGHAIAQELALKELLV